MKKENKYICIWYSWGDIEPLVGAPEGWDAFDYMVSLALREVKTCLVENEEPITVGMNEDEAGNKTIVLNYLVDNEYCYYKVFDGEAESKDFEAELFDEN